MIWKALGYGMYVARKYGGKVVVIFAMASLVVTSPYWSQLGVKVPMEAVEADVGWTPLPMQPTPTAMSASEIQAAADTQAIDASAKFADWPVPIQALVYSGS